MNLGGSEILLLVLIVLLLFGAARLPKLARSMREARDEFQKEPMVWSLGALSAGFALGYAVGYAHKFSTKKAGNSQVAQFTDRMVDELSKVGQSLVVPALGTKMREFFGLDFGQLLHDMGGGTRKRNARKTRSGARRTKSRTKKKAGTKKSKSRK